MDRPPFRQCLTLVASANVAWRDLTATLAVDHGVNVWDWSARLLLDVVALLVKRSAGDDQLTQARVERDLQPEEADGWGTITADEAARIIQQQG